MRKSTPVNAGSMADIAFLLLIFFFVTTTIQSDKGITLLLPPPAEDGPTVNIQDRNLFKILVNSENEILAEREIIAQASLLKAMVREFIINPQNSDELAENPQKAIVSLKTNRGSDYATYIEVLDQLKGAYYEIYANRVNLSPKEFRALDLQDSDQRALYQFARDGIPMNISLAETNIQ